ncbi:MAG: peptide chain release factor N(5)-glutamine methyltransferase [Marinosulfonomonas sp.]|nr:peptide chain release factor N(5)-glutamine methyltransferase [Marinosulfonomonas sp.]
MLAQAAQELRPTIGQGAMRDARVLLAHALGISRDRVTLHLHDDPDAAQGAAFQALIDRRLLHQPVSQIIGQRAFYGLDFTVSGDVLDPRPETEQLVEIALTEPFSNVLDLGTGSGCILLTLLEQNGGANGVGTDISAPALSVAKANAAALNVTSRAEFLISDWYNGVSGQYDLIVSNPPYIAQAEMAGLAPEVRDWEPHIALTPGGDGLNAYRAIGAGARAHLAPGGRLIVEIGPTQAGDVAQIFAQAQLQQIQIAQDLDGRDRIVSAYRR